MVTLLKRMCALNLRLLPALQLSQESLQPAALRMERSIRAVRLSVEVEGRRIAAIVEEARDGLLPLDSEFSN